MSGDATSRDRKRRRVLVGTLGIAAALVVGVRFADANVQRDEPGGARSSAYATTPDGVAAWAELLRRFGHPTELLRGSLAEHAPEPGATLVVIDPVTLEPDEVARLAEHARAGGRLVVGGPDPRWYLSGLGDAAPTWGPEGRAQWVDTTAETTARVVDAGGGGAWTHADGTRRLFGDGSDALVVVEPVGAGEIVYLADVTVVHNERLAEADNAALALALAGPEGSPILFAEGPHGYGTATGIAALPIEVRLAVLLAAVAAALAVWARMIRPGPPDRADVTAVPPRRAYLDALGATLARTGEPDAATAPVAAAVRRAHGIAALDLEADERAATEGPVTDDPGVLARGRALARSRGTGTNAREA